MMQEGTLPSKTLQERAATITATACTLPKVSTTILTSASNPNPPSLHAPVQLSPEDFNPASPSLQLSATGELTLDPDRTVQILAPGLVRRLWLERATSLEPPILLDQHVSPVRCPSHFLDGSRRVDRHSFY